MTKQKKPDPDSVDIEEIKRKMRVRFNELVDEEPMENEPQVLCGSPDLFFKTDAELFPSDLSEYRPEEKKLRLVKTDKRKKDTDDDQIGE
ncbi:hypothetical protein HCH_03812 [Hahella chejuensis KCTC 2396]|uniref:Uncharacterized protein n=1 Tax=Hahella chejuensis (strain KCTC 2396) TaxID=349521 RepID=Q2SFN1_HAHCH|nr:hypothetical protein [Hahella chejuensis]ABC30543.1 hypothetical protein HCH_03812 [Hahella chejuensis KCTC 2396]